MGSGNFESPWRQPVGLKNLINFYLNRNFSPLSNNFIKMSALTGISQVSALTQTTTGDSPRAAEDGGTDTTEPEAPKATPQALHFLNDIDEEDFKHLLFSDGLIIMSDMGKELGDFTVSCEATQYEDGTNCFLVHANSHGAIDNVPCGTSITAWITPKLGTLKQEHHEYVKLDNHPLDRKTFIVKQGEEYIINRVVSQGEETTRTALSIPAERMTSFISEGSNLLLQRLLVKKGFAEPFQLLSFDSDANLCPVVYRSLEERTQVVEETELTVVGVERTINSVSDLPTTWQVYFTKDGYELIAIDGPEDLLFTWHLTSRVQVGSPVTMRISQLPKPVEEEEEAEKPTFGKKELNWEEDMQLYSRFLDRKDELKNEHAVYMRHHPELKSLLSDFLQFLLLRKPDDVISFSADYFSSFSAKMPNQTPYKQSNAPSPFANTNTTAKMKHLAGSH